MKETCVTKITPSGKKKMFYSIVQAIEVLPAILTFLSYPKRTGLCLIQQMDDVVRQVSLFQVLRPITN